MLISFVLSILFLNVIGSIQCFNITICSSQASVSFSGVRTALEYFTNIVNTKEGRIIYLNDSRVFWDSRTFFHTNSSTMMKNYEKCISETKNPLLIAPFGSPAGHEVSTYTEPLHKLLLSFSATQPYFWENKRYSYSTTVSTTRWLLTALSIFRRRSDSYLTLSVTEEPNPFVKDSCGRFREAVRGTALEDKGDFILGENASSYFSLEKDERMIAAVNQAIDRDGDIWIVCASTVHQTQKLVMEYLREVDYMPKALYSVVTDERIWKKENVGERLLEYSFGASTVDDGVRYDDNGFYGTVADVIQDFEAMYNFTPFSYQLEVLVSLHALAIAVNTSQTIEEETLTRTFLQQRVDTILGELSFEITHEQKRDAVLLQLINNETILVGPLLASESDPIYPMPTWSERKFGPQIGDSKMDYFIIVLSTLGIVTSLLWMAFTIIYWNTFVIKASTPSFLILILIGSMILYGSVYTFFPALLSDSVCKLRGFMVDIGFVILFGCLFIKTFRVYRLYKQSKKLKIYKLSDKSLLISIGLIVAAHLIILGVMMIGDMRMEIVVVDEHRVSKNTVVCSSNTSYKIFAWILVGLNTLFFVYGAFLGLSVRKIHHSHFNESKIITFSLYNTGIAAILVIIFQSVSIDDNTVIYISTIGICLATAITIFTLFVSKLLLTLGKGTDGSSNIIDHTHTSNGVSLKSFSAVNTKSTKSTNDEQKKILEKYQAAKKKIAKMKKEIIEYRREIAELKGAEAD